MSSSLLLVDEMGYDPMRREEASLLLATAILDRLLHRAHVLNIKGRSYRLRDLEDALKG
jgi:DNA replication protein DnaC